MQTTPYQKLKELKGVIECNVSSFDSASEVWEHLGWSAKFSSVYERVREHGIDLRSLLAPVFADIVSIVAEGNLNFPYVGGTYSWNDILDGTVPAFSGASPKERMLSVIDLSLECCGN